MSGMERSGGSTAERGAATAGRRAGARPAEPGRTNGRSDLPRLPGEAEAPGPEALERWRAAIRRFHLGGTDLAPLAGPSELGLEPAVLRAMLEPELPARAWPLAILDGEAGREVVSLAELFERALERAAAGGAPLEVLGRSAPLLVRAAERRLGADPAARPDLAAVLDAALAGIGGELDLSAAAAAALGREVERVRPHLPRSGALVPLGPPALLDLFVDAARAFRRPGREALRAEISRLVESLGDLLRLDAIHAPQGRAPETLSAELAAGSAFLDARTLARQLPARHGGRRLDAARRSRIERAAGELRAWLARDAGEPDVLLVLAESLDLAPGPAGSRVIRDEDGLGSAIDLFDGAAQVALETARALRTARLEAAGSYDPASHDEPLARVEWRSFAEEELLLLPAVAVVLDGRRLRETSLASWSSLLSSGRPVRVLVVEPTTAVDEEGRPEALADGHPGLGYLAMAHRETFVLQSSLGRPAHLVAGLERVAAVPGPAVALVAAPRWAAAVPPWVQLATAQACRDAACFRYDPLAGETWAERFDLEGNPQPERAWPLYRVSYRDGSGEEASREEAFTFAHAAAVDPTYRSHFRIVPPEAWTDELVELGEWLDAPDSSRLRRVPYVWIVDDGGQLARAVPTRELTFACRDRARAWRILQELAGLHNEHARRAAERAREEARAAFLEERRALEAAHAEELGRARAEAAGEAMDRLVAVLLGVGTAPGAPAPALATPVPPAEPAPPSEAAGAPAVAVEPASEAEPQVSFDEPYIDSVLCTTCNECTQLNPRMFAYNQNRQAFVADAAAGTFEQLVKAAEKCPARCIHPGAPRAGDSTATADWIARARPFNP